MDNITVSEMCSSLFCERSYYWGIKEKRGEIKTEIPQVAIEGDAQHQVIEQQQEQIYVEQPDIFNKTVETKDIETLVKIVTKKVDELPIPEIQKKELNTLVESEEPIVVNSADVPEIKEVLKNVETVVTTRELTVRNESIRGRIDAVTWYPDKIVITDDKRSSNMSASRELQMRAYGLLFSENYTVDKPMFLELRKTGTDNIFWKSQFDTDEARSMINFQLELAEEVREEKREPFPPDVKYYCPKCRYNRFCKMRGWLDANQL